MVKRKHPKLRACGRWGVWLCALVLVGVTTISFFYQFTFNVSRVTGVVTYDELPRQRDVMLQVSFGRLEIEYFPHSSPGCFGEWGEPGVSIYGDIDRVWRTPKNWWIQPTTHWWSLPSKGGGGSTSGPFDTLNLPMVYPAVLLLGWSLWLAPFWKWWKHIRLEGVECQQCGYSLEGLDSDVCPECGETHEA